MIGRNCGILIYLYASLIMRRLMTQNDQRVWPDCTISCDGWPRLIITHHVMNAPGKLWLLLLLFWPTSR